MTRGSTNFLTGALGLARETTSGTTTSYARDDDGFLLGMRIGAASYFFLYDGLGSVASVTDSTGNEVASYRYDPFGKVVASTGTLQNPHRFLGALRVYFDSATSLYKMGTRYYDAALSRFTQADPVAGGSANRYDYAFQNPVNVSDPDGGAASVLVFGDSGDCRPCHQFSQYMANPWRTAFRRNLARELRRRWARCTLLAAGTVGFVGHGIRIIRIARAAHRRGKELGEILVAIQRDRRSDVIGTGGSLAIVISSEESGGCFF